MTVPGRAGGLEMTTRTHGATPQGHCWGPGLSPWQGRRLAVQALPAARFCLHRAERPGPMRGRLAQALVGGTGPLPVQALTSGLLQC